MSYTTLKQSIQDNPTEDNSQAILTHAKDILVEIGIQGKQKVARDLHIAPSNFTTAYKFILAYYHLTTDRD